MSDKIQWQDIESAPRTGRQPIWLKSRFTEEPQPAFSDTWWHGGFSADGQPTHWAPREE